MSAAGAVFDQAKLEWLSQEYLKRLDGATLVERATPFLARIGITVTDRARAAQALQTLRERAKTLVELAAGARFYFERPRVYESKAAQKLLTTEGGARLDRLIARLATQEPFTAEALEARYREIAAALGVKLVDLAQLTRLALTGGTASPPLFEVMGILGREEVLARLRTARVAVPGRPG